MSSATSPGWLSPPPPPPPCLYFCEKRKFISGGVFFIAPVAFMFTLLVLLLVVQMRRLGQRQRQLAQTRSHLQLIIQNAMSQTSGLPKEVIDSFPIVAFQSWKNSNRSYSEENLQCPVCLGDYEDAEKIRVLPCHVYHVECIDSWLMTHLTCPTCRKSLVPSNSIHDSQTNSSYISDDSHFSNGNPVALNSGTPQSIALNSTTSSDDRILPESYAISIPASQLHGREEGNHNASANDGR